MGRSRLTTHRYINGDKLVITRDTQGYTARTEGDLVRVFRVFKLTRTHHTKSEVERALELSFFGKGNSATDKMTELIKSQQEQLSRLESITEQLGNQVMSLAAMRLPKQ